MFLDDIYTDIILPIFMTIMVILLSVLLIKMTIDVFRNEDYEKTFKDNCIEIEEKYYCEIN